MARFGNAASLYFVDLHELTEIIHDPQQAAKLKAILQIAAEIGKPTTIEHPAIKNCVDLVHYLQATMGDGRVESFRVLFLDAHNRIIADELLWRGTVSEVQVYPREVMRRALELDCSAFIAAHNHPSHAVLPSQADIEMTRRLLTAADTLGIAFHDHFIVSSRSYHSMRFHRSIDPWG
ncbi:RadC family protein [Sphingorhabdus sp.]|uniref:JAB domain-containing protein n=1 Tax=Sphingorhabdus sp. TaxID=1902408 RepID=UPI0035933A81